jgi:hypothetical protein
MKFFLGLAALALAGLAVVQPAGAAATDWRRIARQDVLAAYDLYAANHPGMKDPANPGFPARLAKARDAALRIADHATARADYQDALGAFTAGLADGHAVVYAPDPPGKAAEKLEWPGFVAAWRGSRVLVHFAGPSSPAPVGATIVACDGLAAPEFIRRRLLYLSFRPAEAGQYWSRTPLAFTAPADAPRDRARRCTLRLPDGRRRSVVLRYAPAPDDFRDRLRRASDGERTPIGLSEPRPGLFLIGMPDFQPDEAGVKAYEALGAAIAARRPELLRAKAVVLDLRHNNGGSSDWSLGVAGSLWGKDVVDRAMAAYDRKVRIWWRVSPGNLAYMDEMVRRIRRDGHEDTAASMAAIGSGMKAALANGRPYFVEPQDPADAGRPGPPPASDFTAPVYVITPGRCASACLDGVDTFSRFANVKRIGAPTSADSTYMEVRTAPLPSGQGIAVMPIKMWVNRPRGAGEVYRPDIEMDALDWSTAAFLDRIERDLARAR